MARRPPGEPPSLRCFSLPGPTLVRWAWESEGLSPPALADKVGVAPRTVFRWAAGRSIRMDAADPIAISFGVHPCEIWPEWFDIGIEEEEEAA